MGKNYIFAYDYNDQSAEQKQNTFQRRIEGIQDPIVRYYMKRELDEWEANADELFSNAVDAWKESRWLCWGLIALYILLTVVTLSIFFFAYWGVEGSIPLTSITAKIDGLRDEIGADQKKYDEAAAEFEEQELQKQAAQAKKDAEAKAKEEAKYGEFNEKEFMRFKHAYVSSPDRELAKRVCKQYKTKLDEKHKTLLKLLPLEKELDAMVDEINQTILTLCSSMSVKPMSDEKLKLLDTQCAELKKQADLLNKEVKDRFHKFYDQLRYFKLERSLLKLARDTVKTLPRKIFKVTIKKRAETRLAQFPLFAATLAKKVCGENPNVTVKENALVDILLNCKPFIAYVVRKNDAEFAESDKVLATTIQTNLSNLNNEGQEVSELVEQAVTTFVKEQHNKSQEQPGNRKKNLNSFKYGENPSTEENNNNDNTYIPYQKI